MDEQARGTDTPTLDIALEDAGGTSWWARILSTLSGQTGLTYQRFVGRSEGRTEYKGSTFPVPSSPGPLAPQEEWAPGMTASLAELRRDIERGGWIEEGRGTETWAYHYRRP